MPFIWRQKSEIAKEPAVHAEALSCLEAAYVLADISHQRLHFSYNLHGLCGLGAPVSGMPQLAEALRAESQPRLQQMVQALLQGQITAPVLLHLQDGSRSFSARAFIAPTAPGASRMGVLWLVDASAEARQQARLTQESEKLKAEIKHYSTILNMAPFPIWQRDAELNIRYYNLAYSEAAEAGDEGAGGVPELHRRERALAQSALESGTERAERRHVVIDGQRRLFEIKELPIPQEKMVVGFAHDVTEMEALQEDLQRYISAQGDLLESSASAMAIFGKDMRLKSFNYAYASVWKLDEAWLEAEPSYGEILEALREKRILPEQANFALFKQQQVKLFTDLLEPREEFFYLPDGRSLRVITIPHALGGLLFAYEDVTDRLSLERSYNTLIAVQRETLDNLHEGVAVFGEDGRLKLSNPVYLQMWGLEAQAMRAEPHLADIVEKVKHLYPYDDWEVFKKERIAQMQGRAVQRERLERTDGKVIDCTTVPLPDGATLISYLDVTDSTVVERSLRERNEALQEADRLKSEFLANVSYELRSPLTSISGFGEMLKQEYFGPLTGKQKEYIEGITQSSQHLMQLVNDILDLASIEAGYLQLEVKKFDISAVLKSVLPLVAERVREQEITVTVDCQPRLGKMMGDELRIRQMLFKLLSNAVKFSPPGSAITLGAREGENDTIVLWVQDEGYGIPPEEQERIWGKFFKGGNREAPKSAARSGTGLGLSIVKSFVELHGGTVELQSEEGKGTCIRCILPRENPALLPLMQAKPARRRAAGAGEKT